MIIRDGVVEIPSGLMVMLAVLEFVYFKMGEIGRFFGTLISGCVFKQKHNTDVQMKKTDATATT